MVTTVNVWAPHESQVGHASVGITGAFGDAYISWWPQDAAKEADGGAKSSVILGVTGERYTYERDLAGEGNRQPLQVALNGLDEAKMIAWWGKSQITTWSLLGTNCAQVSVYALREGGADKYTTGIGGWLSSWQATWWKPMEVHRFATEIQKGLETGNS